MTPYYADPWLTVYQGDCKAVMAELPAESVHCVVTSPPYWGLRDYGISDQLGLEATPEEYVTNLVAVFQEVRRVLRNDGTVWLNLGDSYAASTGVQTNGPQQSRNGAQGVVGPRDKHPSASRANLSAFKDYGQLKPKDLVGIPWRVAFALQEDGWYLRSDIIWSKPNPMPESVTDRPTKSHEYLFLLSKKATYYYDADAVREESSMDSGFAKQRLAGRANWSKTTQDGNGRGSFGTVTGNEGENRLWQDNGGRNLRSVWNIATQPYPGAHFASFPRKLVEPCVKAGTSERGVCPECGAPAIATDVLHLPWRLTCEHGGWFPNDGAVAHGFIHLPQTIPATVLDPFAGSGTTGVVAQSLNRRAILIDLNGDYLVQAMQRNRDIPLGLGAA